MTDYLYVNCLNKFLKMLVCTCFTLSYFNRMTKPASWILRIPFFLHLEFRNTGENLRTRPRNTPWTIQKKTPKDWSVWFGMVWDFSRSFYNVPYLFGLPLVSWWVKLWLYWYNALMINECEYCSFFFRQCHVSAWKACGDSQGLDDCKTTNVHGKWGVHNVVPPGRTRWSPRFLVLKSLSVWFVMFVMVDLVPIWESLFFSWFIHVCPFKAWDCLSFRTPFLRQRRITPNFQQLVLSCQKCWNQQGRPKIT